MQFAYEIWGGAFNSPGRGVVDVLRCFSVGWLPGVGGYPVDTGRTTRISTPMLRKLSGSKLT